MAQGKVKTLTRFLHYTATWLAGVLTVTTDTPHYLKTGDTVSLFFNEFPQQLLNIAVTVTDANTFTIPMTYEYGVSKVGTVKIDFYGPGQFGGQEAFTIPRGQGSGAAVIQSFVTGTGGASYTLELSLDKIHWIPAGGLVTHTGVDGDTTFSSVDSAWVYGRLNITTVGAGTTLSVLVSS